MEQFARYLDVKLLLENVRNFPHGPIAILLENWVLPGQQPGASSLGLRLAVRAGYANLYVSGQSAARVSTRGKKISIRTHGKYHRGSANGSVEGSDGPSYSTFGPVDLPKVSASDVARWTHTAATYAGAEKSFVESLVANNANVLDLETALPGKTAPRMDVTVVCERSGQCVIGFWEAKCVNNGELRSSSVYDDSKNEGGPHVFKQTAGYVEWLKVENQREALSRAYRNTAQILVDLTTGLVTIDPVRFAHLAPETYLDERIRRLAERDPTVCVTPGVVVGSYCPSPWLAGRSDPKKHSGAFLGKMESYRRDGHEQRVKEYYKNYVCFAEDSPLQLPDVE